MDAFTKKSGVGDGASNLREGELENHPCDLTRETRRQVRPKKLRSRHATRPDTDEWRRRRGRGPRLSCEAVARRFGPAAAMRRRLGNARTDLVGAGRAPPP